MPVKRDSALFYHRNYLLLALLGGTALSTANAVAQQSSNTEANIFRSRMVIEEVVVRAQRREEDVRHSQLAGSYVCVSMGVNDITCARIILSPLVASPHRLSITRAVDLPPPNLPHRP